MGYRDITGQKFGRLTVLKKDHYDGKRNTYWLCECECGNVVVVQRGALTRGATISCGCAMKEINKKLAKDIELNKMGLEKLKKESFREGTSLKGLTRKVDKTSKTGVKGVVERTNQNGIVYEATIKFKGKCKYLGRYGTLEEARAAREEAEEKLFKPILKKYELEE